MVEKLGLNEAIRAMKRGEFVFYIVQNCPTDFLFYDGATKLFYWGHREYQFCWDEEKFRENQVGNGINYKILSNATEFNADDAFHLAKLGLHLRLTDRYNNYYLKYYKSEDKYRFLRHTDNSIFHTFETPMGFMKDSLKANDKYLIYRSEFNNEVGENKTMNRLEILKHVFNGKKVYFDNDKQQGLELKDNKLVTFRGEDAVDKLFHTLSSDYLSTGKVLEKEKTYTNKTAAIMMIQHGKKMCSSHYNYNPISFDEERGCFVDEDGDRVDSLREEATYTEYRG